MKTQQCSCGWIIRSEVNIVTTCASCKKVVYVDVGVESEQPQVVGSGTAKKPCKHLNFDESYEMECQCGFAHRCKLLNKLAGYSKPIDEFVYTTSEPKVQLNAANFQHCLTCNHRDET